MKLGKRAPLSERLVSGEFSFSELSKALGYSQEYIRHALTGVTHMTPRLALLISNYSHGKIDPYWLLEKYGGQHLKPKLDKIISNPKFSMMGRKMSIDTSREGKKI